MKSIIPKTASQTKSSPWVLKLYVAHDSAASAMAILHARYIVAEYLPKGSTLEVINITDESDQAIREQLLAIPTLIRSKPLPVRRIIGDLSDCQKVLTLLGVSGASQDL